MSKCEDISEETVTRFLDGIELRRPSECWPWIMGVVSKGYGSFSIHDRTHLAHRISWILNNDSIPEGLCVLHHCDNRVCVNPNHLFLGTNGDNCHDMKNKGRAAHPIGELHPLHKLTWAKVDQIRQLAQLGNCSDKALGQMFEVSAACIGAVLRNQTWRREP